MNRLASSFLFLIGVGAVAGVAWWLATSEGEAAPPAGRPPYVLPVTLGEVSLGEVAPRALLTGTVASLETARLGFEVAGPIVELAARSGDTVRKGDLLARLDDGDEQAALASRRAMAQLVEKQLELDLSGERVEEVRRLAAEVAVREAEASLAVKDVERGRGLVESTIISASDFDALVAVQEVAAARVEAAREAHAKAQAGTRAEDIAVRRAELDVRKSEVAIAQRELDKTRLVAPFGGSVVRRLASTGESVAAGEAVYELVDLEHREVQVEIPGRLAARLGERPRVRLTLDDQPRFELVTHLHSLIVSADEQTRNFRGLVRLEPEQDAARVLKPGMFVRLELELEPIRGALVVPSDALRITNDGTIVVRAGEPAPPDGKPGGGEGPGGSGGHGGPGGPGGHGGGPPPLVAEWVPVRRLGSDGRRTAIESLGAPLEPGDRLVLTGVDLAFPGAPLLVRQPAGAEGAGGAGGAPGAGAPGAPGAPGGPEDAGGETGEER